MLPRDPWNERPSAIEFARVDLDYSETVIDIVICITIDSQPTDERDDIKYRESIERWQWVWLDYFAQVINV